MVALSTARDLAFHLIDLSLQERGFVSMHLRSYRKQLKLDPRDWQLAQEIALGTVRMKRALDHLVSQLCPKTTRWKRKEKIVLRMALYQFVFLDRIPSYALINEMVALAKKQCCHISFCRFLNAVLRKLETTPLSLPKGKGAEDLAIRHSYPTYFVQLLIEERGIDTAIQMLREGNSVPPQMARVRKGKRSDCSCVHLVETEENAKNSFCIHCQCMVADHMFMKRSFPALEETMSPEIYIQNSTPVQLACSLAEATPPPDTILDLCAAPGGKLLLCHDLFPEAKLYANDLSEKRLMQLRENLEKYAIKAHVTCSPGEMLHYPFLFDLIVIDAPCSNSGVLHKRAEARWRITKEQLTELETIQLALIKRATEMVRPGGTIWYLTCSILCSENERIVEKACALFSLENTKSHTCLPNKLGWDGGFGALLRKKE